MNLSLTIWGHYLVVLSSILTLVTAQCANNNVRVEFFEDGQILSRPAMVNKSISDSFIIGCQRCNTARGPPLWFYPGDERIEVVPCNGFNDSVCVEMNENTNMSNLHFTSFTASQAGRYRCTNQEISISAYTPAIVATSIRFSQTMYSKAENEGSIEIKLVLSNTLPVDVTLQVISSDNTATGGNDYTIEPSLVMIPAGERNGSFEISIIDDKILENDESFDLNINTNTLPGGITIGSPDTATVIITNDDTADIGFEQNMYSVSERDGLLHPVIILNTSISRDITIEVNGRPGNATGYNDYNPGPYHVTIPAGMTRVRFTVTITDDDVQENDETFRLSIRDNLSDDFTFSNRIAMVTIINDDIDVLAVSLSFNPTVYIINENAGFVQPTLTLSAPLTTDLTLQVTNINSTANVEDNDYNPGPYSVTFVTGQTDASFDVTINDDDMLERDESFMLKIDDTSLSLDMVTLDTNNDEATVTIMNDDSSVVRFSQSMYRVFEDDELVQPALVLNNPSSSAITVRVNDNSITATEGDDYNSGPYFVNFPARTNIVSFNVSIVKDNITEGNENFQLAIDSSTLPDGVTVDATSNRDTEIIIVSGSNDEGNSTDSSSSSGSVIPIITGSVLGATLFIISCLVCIIILLVRQSRKKTVDASEKVVTEMGSDIKMNTNPSYEVTKQKPKQEPQYDCVAYNQLGNNHDNIKMDTNPSYGTVHCANSDVAIQDNPSYEIVQGAHNARDKNEDVHSTQEAGYVNAVGSTMH